EEALDTAGITVNNNMIPFDERAPVDPSGIRIGTPALTSRGMKTDEMRQIAKWIARVLRNAENAAELARVREAVVEMTTHYPLHDANAFA
ncbi:serine hydroxymethyltransferase, partial [Arthrospira platensis SPKY1]|nr:serine hydroxymethyltransferase [Arthrospira platensis SPKY1]